MSDDIIEGFDDLDNSNPVNVAVVGILAHDECDDLLPLLVGEAVFEAIIGEGENELNNFILLGG